MAFKIKFRYTMPTHLSKENMSLYMEEDKDFVSKNDNMWEYARTTITATSLHNVIEPYNTYRHILQITSPNSS